LDYFVLKVPTGKGGLIESYPKSNIADWKYAEGELLLPHYPQRGSVHFSKSFPDWRALLDFQPTTRSAVFISAKARKVLEAEGVANVEYLPVAVEDHRGTVIGPDYSIANVLGSEPAINMEKSDYRLDNLEKDQIDRMRKMVLAPQRVSPEAKLFRLKEMRTTFLVRDDLRLALLAAGATGCVFEPADGWKSRVL
jgi:hypothetical protein